MTPIILLSGPVGAGKTTVARELIELLPEPVSYIEGDQFWRFIAKGGKTDMGKNFATIMGAMTAAAVPYALAGYHVVLDFSVPPWFLGAVKAIAGFRKVPLHFVVLRPSETVCARRAAERSEGTIPDYRRYHDLYREFDQVPAHIIADDEGSAKQVAVKVWDGVKSRRFEA